MTRPGLARRPISRLWLNRRVRQLLPLGKAHLLVCVLLVIVVSAGVVAVLDGYRLQRRQPPAMSGISAKQRRPTSTVQFKPGLEADVYRPDRKRQVPAVLLVHGGGLWAGSRADVPLARLADRLRARGILAVSIDYTLGEGFEPPSRDVRDALAWLRTVRAVDPDRIAMVGQSAGAGLVAYTAFQDPVRAVVLSSPGGGTDIVSAYGSSDDPETLVLRGADDTLAPLSGVTELV